MTKPSDAAINKILEKLATLMIESGDNETMAKYAEAFQYQGFDKVEFMRAFIAKGLSKNRDAEGLLADWMLLSAAGFSLGTNVQAKIDAGKVKEERKAALSTAIEKYGVISGVTKGDNAGPSVLTFQRIILCAAYSQGRLLYKNKLKPIVHDDKVPLCFRFVQSICLIPKEATKFYEYMIDYQVKVDRVINRKVNKEKTAAEKTASAVKDNVTQWAEISFNGDVYTDEERREFCKSCGCLEYVLGFNKKTSSTVEAANE